jgi:hypothetical protein
MKLANLVDLNSPFDYLSIGFLHLNRGSEGYFRLLKKQNIVVVISRRSSIQTNAGDHEEEKEHLIAQGRLINDTRQRRTNSLSLTPLVRFQAGSETHLAGDPDSPTQTDDPDRPRRARSMLGGTNCVPS